MDNLNILIEAVDTRKPISFEYNKPGKIQGERIGNIHAIFILTTKAGVKSTKLHIVQTGGVSDSKEINPFPDFRLFNIVDLSNIKILKDEAKFEINQKYKPEWEGYINTIAKV